MRELKVALVEIPEAAVRMGYRLARLNMSLADLASSGDGDDGGVPALDEFRTTGGSRAVVEGKWPIRMVAMERRTVHRILASPGDDVTQSDILGMPTTIPEEPLDVGPVVLGRAKVFRAVREGSEPGAAMHTGPDSAALVETGRSEIMGGHFVCLTAADDAAAAFGTSGQGAPAGRARPGGRPVLPTRGEGAK